MPIHSCQLATKLPKIVKKPTNSVTTNRKVDGENEVDVNINKLSCSMCGKSEPHALVDLSANMIMRRTLTNLIHQLCPEDLETTLKSICVQCIYKANACKEVTRTLQLRLHRSNNFAEYEDEMLNCNELTNNVLGEKLIDKKKTQQTLINLNEISKNYKNEICHQPNEVPSCNTTEVPRAIEAPIDISPICLENSTNTPSLSSIPKHNVQQKSYNENFIDNNPFIAIQHSTPNGSYIESDIMQLSPASIRKKQRERYVVEVEDITPVRDIPDELLESSTKDSSTSTFDFTELPVQISNANETILRSQSNSSSQQNNLSMLQIASERSECALITESGGKINKYKHSQRAAVQCTYCTRTYWRKDFYTKHIRKCQARNRLIAAAPNKNLEDVYTKQTEQTEIVPNLLKCKFRCSQCMDTFSSRQELKRHKRTHFRLFVCDICDNKFDTKYGYEIHYIICEAKKAATYEMSLSTKKVKSCCARVTRSRSIANTMRTKTTQNDTNSIYIEYESNAFDYDNDDVDNDAISVADTMYTKRMRFTGDWIEVLSNSNSRMSICDNFYDYDIDAQISSYKEYDLHLLDLLKAQIFTTFFTSFATNCNFTTNSLVELMAHDYLHHFRRAWFYCRKCGRVFTSKVFLDYHLDRQNGGRYICYKCGDIFEFQHQLDRHMIRHTKCINYRCNYCNLEFLTENELLQHSEIEQHDPNSERKLISIDPSMTITNPIISNTNKDNIGCTRYEHGCNGRRIYSVKTINMLLPKVPSLRPMNLPGHKPYRRLIGDIEFKNQKNPNCWGWK